MEIKFLVRFVLCLIMSLFFLISGIVLLTGKPKIHVMFLGYVGKMTITNEKNRKIAVKAMSTVMIITGIVSITETLVFNLLNVDSIIFMPVYGSTLILGSVLMLLFPKYRLKKYIKHNHIEKTKGDENNGI